MNCSEFCRILDEHTVADLSATQTAEIRAHVVGCADCAGQMLACESVAALRVDVPPLPAALAGYARALHERLEGQASERPSRRPVLIGSLLLLGAAATMFAAVPAFDDRATT